MSIYLEKYTVAPAPSRDYYGIKVFSNEIKIYHWRISYGPHKYPRVISINFNEWCKTSDDIRVIFGKSIVECIDKIINKKYLLTLPVNFLNNLLKYLSIKDIKNFCLVSRTTYQIIKNLVVKELINKKLKINNKLNKSMAYSWDELLKETNDIDKRLYKNQRIKGSDKNFYKKLLKPQLEISRTVSWTKNLKDAIRSSVSDNSIKSKPSDLSTKRVNIINVPSTEEIINKNILTDVSNEPNQELIKLRDKIKMKSKDFKFLTNNKNINSDLPFDLSRLKASDIDLDTLVQKTMDEYKKSKELINCKFGWIDDLETREPSPRFSKSKPGTGDSVATRYFDKRPGATRSSVDFAMNRLMSSINDEDDEFDDKADKMTPWERVKLNGFKLRESKSRSEGKFKFDGNVIESLKKNPRRQNN